MKKLLLFTLTLLFLNTSVFGQLCKDDQPIGQNLIKNGDFENGYTDFNSDLSRFTSGETPGKYFVGSNPKSFNQAFSATDHTTGSGNVFMADASNDPTKTRMWYQMVEVKPNTNYYFTAHIANLVGKGGAIVPQLLFKVDGKLLADTIDAPLNTGLWNDFTSQWYSGASSGMIEISIENIRVGGGDEGGGNDMALDDISFVEGCEFASQNIIPELGPDTLTICGTTNGVLELKPDIPDTNTYEFVWSTGETTPQINVDKPGRYAVCMRTNGGCFLSDIVTIIDDFKVDLGPDIDLCNPATAVLNPSYDLGSGYDWFKDGDSLGNFRNQNTIQINEVGTYKVVVHDLICDDEEDEVIISSSTIQAVNANFCPADGDSVELQITNATSNPTNYVWYSDAALTDSVGFGLNFKTTDTLTKTTPFYVKDVSTVSSVTGPIGNSSTFSSGSPFNDTSESVEFTVNNDFTLDSLTIYAVWSGFQNVIKTGIKILEWDNGPVGPVIAEVVVDEPATSDNCNCPEALGAKQVLAIGADLEKGKTYRIYLLGKKLDGSSSQIFAYQPTSPSGLAGFSFNSDFITLTQTVYGSSSLPYFNWVISAGSVCDPVEVQAVFDPIACAGCTPPVLANTPLNVGVSCNSGPVTLKAEVIDGTNNGLWNYSWTRNGVALPIIVDSLVVSFPDSGNYTVTVEDIINPTICFESRTFRVNLASPPKPIVDIDIAIDEKICLVSDITTSASVQNFTPTPTVFQWFRNDTLQTTTSKNITINLKDGDELKVAVSGFDGCGNAVSAVDSVTIQGLTIETSSVSLSPISICQGDEATVQATITPAEAAVNAVYAWSINGGANTATTDTLTDIVSDKDSVSVVVTIVAEGCYSTNIVSAFTKAQVSSALVPQVFISPDTNDVCASDLPLVFSVDSLKNGGVPSYQWFVNGIEQVNETTDSFTPESISDKDTVNLIITSSLSCVTVANDTSNSVIVIINPTATLDVAIESATYTECKGDTINFIASSNATGSYAWKINNEAPVVSVDNKFATPRLNSADTVSVIITPNAPYNKCGIQSDTVFINELMIPADVTIGLNNLTICDTKGLTVFAVGENHGSSAKYSWTINGDLLIDSTASISPKQIEDGDTVFVRVVSSETCVTFDTASTQSLVTIIPNPEVILAVNEMVLPDYKEVTLDANKSELSGATYSWVSSDSTLYDDMVGRYSTVAKVTPQQVSTKFYFFAARTENGVTCSDLDSVHVIVDYSFEIPNAFSPNGDGLNDFFQIKYLEKLDAFRLQIFNRWGTLIYEQKGLSDFWDGTYNGSPVPVATYYYVFEYELNGEKQKPKKDFISLIR